MSTLVSPHVGLRWFLSFTLTLPSRFQRSRVWSPQSVMVWLMLLTFPDRKTSYRRSLRMLETFGSRRFGWKKPPTLASIAMARRKMSVPMCREILQTVVSQCYMSMGVQKEQGSSPRFIAFDGTRLVTKRSADTARKLHRYQRPNGERVHNPQGLMVSAVDLHRRLPLDWVMVGKGTGERTALQQLLTTVGLRAGDVAIMDRGLPSRELFDEILARGADIVARMTTAEAIAWTEIVPFLNGKERSAVIEVQVGERGDRRPIYARIVERDPRPGRPRKGTKKERMVILTTLKEEDGYSRQEIVKIYSARWGIESLFAELKSFMQVEPFHTKTVLGCEQEIAASLIWMALASFIQAEAERTLEGRRVYRSDCLRASADLLDDLLAGRSIDERMQGDIDALRRFSYAPRPNRHAPRECKMPFGRSVQRGLR